MKLLRYLMSAMVLTLGLTSCSITRYKSYAPNTTQLSLQMADLKYLGETTINVEYRTYLGLIRIIDTINGVPYNGDEIQNFPIINNSTTGNDLQPCLRKASYKLLKDFPEADYFIVTNQVENKIQLFLGSHKTATAKVKAYSLK